jgi:hypothetical protein
MHRTETGEDHSTSENCHPTVRQTLSTHPRLERPDHHVFGMMVPAYAELRTFPYRLAPPPSVLYLYLLFGPAGAASHTAYPISDCDGYRGPEPNHSRTGWDIQRPAQRQIRLAV